MTWHGSKCLQTLFLKTNSQRNAGAMVRSVCLGGKLLHLPVLRVIDGHPDALVLAISWPQFVERSEVDRTHIDVMHVFLGRGSVGRPGLF